MYFLDTCAVIELLKGSQTGDEILKIILDGEAIISSIVYFELLSTSKKSNFCKLKDLLTEFPIFEFDHLSAEVAASLCRDLLSKGKPINDLDLAIAGHCLNSGMKLLTLDKHFKRVPKLDAVVCKFKN